MNFNGMLHRVPVAEGERWLRVVAAEQRLELRQGREEILRVYVVSTSRFGLGEGVGSHCTPRGWHVVREKIGTGAPWGAQFIGRQWTGKVWPRDFEENEGQDWILTRILWLAGLEERNKTTYERYIYIHGTADEQHLGAPRSMGCIRMSNDDVLDLYDRVEVGTRVWIE
ncbi:MAG: L,D-transpeptidase [Methylacidiphilales bacterium]|nr:L,D-transpeptidase [Candidatus Methylacidiphilales bacterium]MDW8349371.1 L,D-transpeptidase [Verrucomicrobiae bacterium]